MICTRCHGTGFVFKNSLRMEMLKRAAEGAPCEITGKVKSADDKLWAPCPECHGNGIMHCCDGLCEQPEG